MSTGMTLAVLFMGEAILLMSVIIALLFRKNANANKKLRQMMSERAEEPGMNAHQLFDYLMHETREFLDMDDAGKINNKELSAEEIRFLQFRMAYLQNEQTSLSGNDQVQTQWSRLFSGLTDLLPQPPQEAAPVVEVASQAWKKAKESFSGMQDTMYGYMGVVQDLVHDISELASGNVTADKVSAKVAALEQFKEKLFDNLDTLEGLTGKDLLDEVPGLDQEDLADSLDGFNELRTMLAQSGANIDSIKGLASSEQLSRADLAQLEAEVNKMDGASTDLKLCVETLKMEQMRRLEEKIVATEKESSLFHEIGSAAEVKSNVPATPDDDGDIVIDLDVGGPKKASAHAEVQRRDDEPAEIDLEKMLDRADVELSGKPHSKDAMVDADALLNDEELNALLDGLPSGAAKKR